MGANSMIKNKILIFLFITSLFFVSLFRPSIGVNAQHTEIPTITYDSGKYQLKSPDWSKISWSILNPIQQPGYIDIPENIAAQLGYNPSRIWSAGQSIDSVVMLGDVDEAFAQSRFTLKNINNIVGDLENFQNLTLQDFGLIKWQTVGSLVEAIPDLKNFDINQIEPIRDLLSENLNYTDFSFTTLQDILEFPELSNLSLGSLDLSKYLLGSIPKLVETEIEKFSAWQQSFIKDVPGLNQVTFDKMPQPIDPGLDVVGIASLVLSGSERGDSKVRDNYFVSGKVSRSGQNVPVACQENKECSYLELGDFAGTKGSLYGKRWAAGTQQVDGGFGILQAVNGGKEPTGRLVYGPGFKVVLTDVNESTGTANFGLFFRFCIRFFLGGRSCSPYFIGPVPWISTQENNLVILGRG
jgi:hypothetical protein